MLDLLLWMETSDMNSWRRRVRLESSWGKSEPMFHLSPLCRPLFPRLGFGPSPAPLGPSPPAVQGEHSPSLPLLPPQLFPWSSKVLPGGCSPSRPAVVWVHHNELPSAARLAVHPLAKGGLPLGQGAAYSGRSLLLCLLLDLALSLGQCTPH